MSEFDRFFSQLTQHCVAFRPVDEAEAAVLWQHYQLMLRWNKKLNLTRIVELEEAVSRHYVEGIFLSHVLGDSCHSAVDLGSGAGFPGYPVAVMCPSVQVTLLESDQRKAAFLREACGDRSNIRVISQRSDNLSGAWDYTISRAVRAIDIVQFAKRVSKRLAVLVSTSDVAEWLNTGELRQVQTQLFPWDSSASVVTADVPRGTLF